VTGFPVEEAIARAHHEEWARVVAGLARRFGDLDLAALQDRYPDWPIEADEH
jgi:predicted RNA polymerase sigma factor